MASARHLQLTIKTHAQKVLSLYKRALRNEWSVADPIERWECRYKSALLRKRFDDHRDEKDMRKAKKLLEDGEIELEDNLDYQPLKFSYSPGGINYERVAITPDWVLDQWHPLEKAQYPEYFARREQRKKEYIERWEKKYGKPESTDEH